MKQLPNYGDVRQLARCVYCGGDTGTRDHVPSKILLDEPYPSNLPVVPACHSCNEAVSLDEEYLACLIECTLVGSAFADKARREKVKRILSKRPRLVSMLTQSRQVTDGTTFFRAKPERVRNVIMKLARGHAAFELNEPQFADPALVTIVPLTSMNTNERERFETPPWSSMWPEVGSRAMHRLIVSDPGATV